jgi:hypothetical protein
MKKGWTLGISAILLSMGGTITQSHGLTGDQDERKLSLEGEVSTQEKYNRGQNIAPVYEGWEPNPDGTINVWFGYMNRNWEEQPDIPVGSDNRIEPGGPDQTQPTHFFPRRNKFVFKIVVPNDFGRKELVWALTVHGKTERAYATLHPDYVLEKNAIQALASMLVIIPGSDANEPPVARLQGDSRRTVKIDQPLVLSGSVTDDGLLKPRPTDKIAPDNDQTSVGLRVAWFVYRGPADKVSFEPEQFKVYRAKQPGGNSPWTPGWMPPPLPPDGKFPVKVRFHAPGVFVIRMLAHDGGLQDYQDVTVTVAP